MDVNKQLDFPAFQSFPDHVLHSEDLWRSFPRRLQPLPIEIMPAQASSVITSNHSIRVKHRHNLENILVSQTARFWLLAHEKIDDAFHYKGSIRLARMDSWAEYDSRPFGDVILWAFQICDDKHIESITCDWPCELGSLEAILRCGWIADSVEMVEHVRISIGVAVCYINYIVIIYKFDLETERVRSLLISRYLLDLLLSHKVLDIMAASIPTVACRLHILLWIDEWLHPLAVRGIWFA